MRAKTALAFATALATTLAVGTAASAATIIISDSYDGGALTVRGVGTNAGVASFSEGVFQVNLETGISGVSPLLNTTSNNQISAADTTLSHTLDIFITAEGLTSPLGLAGFVSTFQTNFLPAGWTLVERTLLDPTNHAPGDGAFAGTPLSSASWSGGPLVQQATGQQAGNTGAGPYSLTAEYFYTAGPNVTGTASSTIAIAAVPEPGVWALMIFGFGGAGAMLRKRRALALA
jgi:hypothetical protein